MPFISSVRGSYGAQGRFGRARSVGLGSTGGTITTAGGYRIHTFTTVGSSTFTPDATGNVEYLIVAGGGSGGSDFGGGGGAGGLLYSSSYSVSPSAYAITVGNGGAAINANRTGPKGTNSSIGSIVAFGGGGGGCQGEYTPGSQLDGGSGGDASHNTSQVGQGVAGQGYPSGDAFNQGPPYAEGGGGGAGEKGLTPSNASTSVRGGNGLQYSISGTNTYYAGGGGGGGGGPSYNANTTNAIGGLGGGGRGGPTANSNGVAGSPNTGGGGGGAHTYQNSTYYSGAGGSGIVIIRYPI
jgi:hypothetical protein